MSSRDAILQRIRTQLSGQQSPPLPPVPEVWPRLNPPAEEMARRFQEELEAVHGEVLRVGSVDDARERLAELVEKENWARVGCLDRPLGREVAEGLPCEVSRPAPDWTPQTMAALDAAVLEPEWLLADTGSSVVVAGTAPERILCYLPPACVVVARLDRLREHLPAAWAEIGPRVADPQVRGEFVVITGPSRTADIEKILILGVHGPKRLIALLIG